MEAEMRSVRSVALKCVIAISFLSFSLPPFSICTHLPFPSNFHFPSQSPMQWMAASVRWDFAKFADDPDGDADGFVEPGGAGLLGVAMRSRGRGGWRHGAEHEHRIGSIFQSYQTDSRRENWLAVGSHCLTLSQMSHAILHPPKPQTPL